VVIFGDIIAAYGVIRGLSKHRVPMYMVSPDGQGWATKSRFVKDTLTLHPFDPEFMPKLDEWLCEIVGDTAVLMVAGSDHYLDVLSQRYTELNANIKTTFPDWKIVKLVREKRHSYRIAEELGIPIPRTVYISSLSELDQVLRFSDKGFTYPILMKPEDSMSFKQIHGNKGVLCHSENEIRQAFVQYDGFGGNLLLQEFVPGDEDRVVTAVIVLNHDSAPIGFMINHKKRVAERFLGCSAVETTWSDEVLNYSLEITRRIGYYGYTGNQFKLDPRDGQYKLMEINGRITMSNSLALKLGINLPYLMYKEAIAGPLEEIAEFVQPSGADKSSLWIDFFADVIHILKKRTFKHFLNDYLLRTFSNTRMVEPVNLRDPLPFLMRFGSVISSFLKNRFLRNR
jgi:D-aspartate ligase